MNQLDWLGEVPKRWRVVKLRQILRPFSEKNHPDLPLLSVVREKGVIVRNVADKEENHNYVPEDLSGYKRVKRGQFAMNKMKAWQGSYGVSKYDGIVSPAYYVFDIDYDIDHDFFNAAIRSKAYVSYFGQASDGIRVGQWDLSMQRMKEIPFLVPPHDEQEQIVRFLDWKVSAINRLINLRRKEITALEDLKRSIIHHAVTHGIKPNVPMKDSGVQWIGKIPVHWKISRIKNELDNLDYLREPVSAENRDNRLGLYDYYGASGIIDKIDSYNVDDTVLLIGEDGANLVLRHLPLVYKASGKFWVNNHAHILKVHANNDYDFFAYLLEAGDYSIYITGSAQPKLTQTNLMSFQIPLPHIDEQIVIADFLNKKCAAINELAKVKNKYLEKLQDLRARLISDVVTGKIDVRGVEVPEFAPVEEEAGTDMNEEEVGEEID